MLQNIRFLLYGLGISMTHIFKKANSVYDALASIRLGLDNIFTLVESLPLKVRLAMQLDRLSITFVRHCVIKKS